MYYIKEHNRPDKVLLKREPTIPDNSTVVECNFGEYVQIGTNNNIQESEIGNFSYTSEHCQIVYSEIGNFVNIASFVRLNPGQHPMHRASQHHMLYRREMFGLGEDDSDYFAWRRANRVTVGHDVWIGHSVTVMGGVTIGNGAVIGSGAIVTKDIPPYAIAVGNPAKVIRYRFDSDVIKKLEQIAWWNWDHATIKERIEKFNNIEEFLKEYEN
jgi:phosphonate metabolism protein (transferase hexapeptide repeat family)